MGSFFHQIAVGADLDGWFDAVPVHWCLSVLLSLCDILPKILADCIMGWQVSCLAIECEGVARGGEVC